MQVFFIDDRKAELRVLFLRTLHVFFFSKWFQFFS